MNISQGKVRRVSAVVGYLIITLSVCERILKMGQHLEKFEAKVEWHVFFRTRCKLYCKTGADDVQVL